jgi:anti-sigma factor RsiW
MSICPHSLDISAYHDDELSPEKRVRLETHLQTGCPACVAELRQWQKLSSLIASAPTPVFTAAARDKLYKLAPVVEELGLVRVAIWATALAASVLIVVGAWMASTQGPTRQIVETPTPPYVLRPAESTDLTTEAPAKPQFDDWAVEHFATAEQQ